MLVRFVNGKCNCRIYNHPNRLGRVIGQIDGEKFYCWMRERVHKNYKGCPYNRPEWGEDV